MHLEEFAQDAFSYTEKYDRLNGTLQGKLFESWLEAIDNWTLSYLPHFQLISIKQNLHFILGGSKKKKQKKKQKTNQRKWDLSKHYW